MIVIIRINLVEHLQFKEILSQIIINTIFNNWFVDNKCMECLYKKKKYWLWYEQTWISIVDSFWIWYTFWLFYYFFWKIIWWQIRTAYLQFNSTSKVFHSIEYLFWLQEILLVHIRILSIYDEWSLHSKVINQSMVYRSEKIMKMFIFYINLSIKSYIELNTDRIIVFLDPNW